MSSQNPISGPLGPCIHKERSMDCGACNPEACDTLLGFYIDATDLNSLQIESIRKAVETTKQSHYIDIDFRINGVNLRLQGDWIKNLQEFHDTDESWKRSSMAWAG